MSDSVFTGCMPALMTPCTERDGERAPDFDALAEKGKELVDAGMSGVVSVSYTHLRAHET